MLRGFLKTLMVLFRCSGRTHGGGVSAAFFATHFTLCRKVDICGRDDLFTFFSSSLDFGWKTDVITFKEPVLLLRCENISGPAGMA